MILRDLKNYFNKVTAFYFPERAGYWNSITPCSISSKPAEPDRYYLDFSSKADYPGILSEEGIPQYSHRGSSLIEHPIVIAQYALGIFELLYRKNFNDTELANKFLKTAEWFDRNKADIIKGGKVWFINIHYPEYDLNYPWISCMAQGEAVSVLSRAALISRNEKFEKLAEEALIPFEFEVKDNGLLNYFNGIPVYEEFPTPIRTMAVLNGFIFSLFGMYDLYLLNKNEKALRLFSKGIDSLKKILPYFDIKTWTRYYLFDYPKKYYSSYTYHILVAEQLKALFYLTGDDYFMEYSEKFTAYSKNFIKKNLALLRKITYANKVMM
jgi:hypothetical protein